MAQLYLITGFLGAGKTTLLKNMLALFPGRKLRVIVNEFGSEGVDGKIISEWEVAVSEITNGSIFCNCRIHAFEDVLAQVLAESPDVIFVETSGLSDPTNIRKILTDNPRLGSVDFRGGLCLVDAVRFRKVFSTARVVKKQLLASQVAVINKTDLVEDAEIDAIEALLLDVNPGLHVHRTAFGALQREWLPDGTAGDAGSAPSLKDVSLQSYTLTLAEGLSKEQLRRLLSMLLEDSWRIKGIARLQGGERISVSCVGGMAGLSPYDGPAEDTGNGGRLVALAGSGMPLEKSIARAREWYPDMILAVH